MLFSFLPSFIYLSLGRIKKGLQNEVDLHKFHATKKHLFTIFKYIIQVVLERRIVMIYDQVFI